MTSYFHSFTESVDEKDLKKIINDMDSRLSALNASRGNRPDKGRNAQSIENNVSLQYRTLLLNGYECDFISLFLFCCNYFY